MTPTQRSLKLMRDAGYFCAVVEKWNPHARIRQDLFGMFDLLAFNDNLIVGIQTTSGSNVGARIKKLRANKWLWKWLASEHRQIWVHGWRKAGPRGERKTWKCREVLVFENSDIERLP